MRHLGLMPCTDHASSGSQLVVLIPMSSGRNSSGATLRLFGSFSRPPSNSQARVHPVRGADHGVASQRPRPSASPGSQRGVTGASAKSIPGRRSGVIAVVSIGQLTSATLAGAGKRSHRRLKPYRNNVPTVAENVCGGSLVPICATPAMMQAYPEVAPGWISTRCEKSASASSQFAEGTVILGSV